MIKQDILENQVNTIYLAIGSNLGNKRFNIEKTKYLLKLNSINIIRCSSYYESPSWPNNNHPSYYNIVIKAQTKLTYTRLFLLMKKIEKSLGRVIAKKNSPRICDIDIIDFNNKTLFFKINDDYIEIPHPRLVERNFVLIPLYELDKKWIHPINKKKIGYLINKLEVKSLSAIKHI